MHMSFFAPGRRTRVGLVAAALAVVSALTACSPSGGQDSGGQAEKSITLSLTNTPNSFDPSAIGRNPESVIWTALYDRLITIAPDGGYLPGAAKSWEYSDGNTKLTLKLRDDLSFEDGTAIDSQTVVANLEYVRKTPGPAQGDTAYFQNVEAPDKSTVVINLKQPDPSLIDNLSVNLGVIASPGQLGSKSLATDPLSSGPYELDNSSTVNGSVYVMKLRDGYWGAKNFPFQTLKVKTFADPQAQFNALSSGEIDAAYIKADQLSAFKNDGYTQTQINGIGNGSVMIADRAGKIVPALADVRVRQAINMAFDRKTIVEKLQGGIGAPAYQSVFEGVPGYSKTLDGTYEYDPKRARELLAEAGYPNGFSVTLPSTFLSQQIDPTIVQQLGAIGITAKLETVQPQDLGKVWTEGKYALGYWINSAANPARALVPQLTANGNFNSFHITTPQGDALLKAVGLAQTPEEIDEAWQKVSAYAVEQAIAAPISFSATTLVAKSGIKYLGTVPPAIQTVSLYTPAN